ncbi:MAG: BrnT family toxin [Deltaproteobacteria bacterium]|nr:BrnT family toxin [Deltaproteobacteria bacterium]
MKFIWDPVKEKINIQKHKISFTESCYVFADQYSLNLFDEQHSEDEDRWITLGQTPNGKILIVVHTFKKIAEIEVIRIISSRKATKKETKKYLERRR